MIREALGLEDGPSVWRQGAWELTPDWLHVTTCRCHKNSQLQSPDRVMSDVRAFISAGAVIYSPVLEVLQQLFWWSESGRCGYFYGSDKRFNIKRFWPVLWPLFSGPVCLLLSPSVPHIRWLHLTHTGIPACVLWSYPSFYLLRPESCQVNHLHAILWSLSPAWLRLCPSASHLNPLYFFWRPWLPMPRPIQLSWVTRACICENIWFENSDPLNLPIHLLVSLWLDKLNEHGMCALSAAFTCTKSQVASALSHIWSFFTFSCVINYKVI